MSWLPESHRVRATETLSVGIGGATPRDRHGESLDPVTLLPEELQPVDWTDEEAEVKKPAKPVVRGRLSRINRRGVCGKCWIVIQAVGGCQYCEE